MANCGCYTGAWFGVVPPPMCVMHGGLAAVVGSTTVACSTTPPSNTIIIEAGNARCGAGCAFLPCSHFPNWIPTPRPSVLSDHDVERVARRVAELLKAG